MQFNFKNPEEIMNTFQRLGYEKHKIIKLNKYEEGFQNEQIEEIDLISNTNDFRIYLFKLINIRNSTMKKVAYKMYNKAPMKRNLLIFISELDDNLNFLHYHTTEKDEDKLDIKILEVNPSDIKATDEKILKLINISDLNLTSEEIFRKHIEAFKIEAVSDEFFKSFDDTVKILSQNIEGFVSNEEKENYAVLVLSRLIFLYFIQKKGWLNGEKDYLYNRFLDHKRNDRYSYYDKVLKNLFFNCLNTPVDKRKFEVKNLCSTRGILIETKNTKNNFFGIPYLNGGLFQEHKKYNGEINIKINNTAFESVFKNLLNKYNFTVRESIGDEQIAVDPELLGKIYENMINSKEKSTNGIFYTPKVLINYMCFLSIKQYLKDLDLDEEKIKILLRDKDEKNESQGKYVSLKVLSKKDIEYINNKLKELKICDFAVGSGAFILGMLQLLTSLRLKLERRLRPNGEIDIYDLKKEIIEENLYGVDINEDAIEICHLRLWLSLAVESTAKGIEEIKPLPNLKYKIMVGNSVITDIFNSNYDEDIDNTALKYNESFLYNKLVYKDKFEKLIECKKNYFNANENKYVLTAELVEAKKELTRAILKDNGKYENEAQLEKIIEKESSRYFSWKINFPEVFIKEQNPGFHIVIGNPPYVDVRKVNKLEYAEKLEEYYGFKDDLYNHFTFRGMGILRNNGHLNVITANTFLKIQSKENMRKLLQNYELKFIIETPKYFKALVDTAIFMVKKKVREDNYKFYYLGRDDFSFNKFYKFQNDDKDTDTGENSNSIEEYRKCLNKVFFQPSKINKQIYKKYNFVLCNLFYTYGKYIKDSKKIRKNKKELDKYRKALKPGDITLLGLITEGGQGLATGDNGRYLAVLENTHFAEHVKEKRIEVFYKNIIKKEKVKTEVEKYFCEISKLNTKKEIIEFFKEKSEEEIDTILTKLKTEVDKDILGRGFIYRIISEDYLADLETLSEEDKINGINHEKKVYVPYDKGDKEGNRWYLETPYYINWSQKNVDEFKNSSKARWQGYDYFFKESICWNLINGTRDTNDIKSRLLINSVNDVGAMKLTLSESLSNKLSNKYIIFLLNSSFISHYSQEFINYTINFQINDARKLPIIIPTQTQLNYVNELVDSAIDIRKRYSCGEISKEEEKSELEVIENKVDDFVYKIYDIIP